MPLSRRRLLAAVGLTALAGCNSGASTARTGGTATGERGDETTDERGDETTDERGDETADERVTLPVADERLPLPASPERLRREARSGGPPKDGIPAIDEPAFVGAEAADFLDPGDPVFGVVRGGAAKAYPQKILVHHEIVNDELAGTPVSVTYCPLTGTVQGFERGGTTFGVSGRLINANLVMYDRATETWWPQMLATAIPGPWNETPEIRSLREFRLIWTTWRRWRKRNPETRVLSTDTGYARNYGRDPYGRYDPRGGYYENDELLFPPLTSDDRYDRKAIVMGARTPGGAVAFPKDAVRDRGLIPGTIGDAPVFAVYDPRYDTAYVYRNPDGAAFEFDRGSVVAADGTRYEPDEVPLPSIHTFDAMWFAWAGYYPDTDVHE
jgi:hypothetical protein